MAPFTYYPYFDYLRIGLASVVMFTHAGLSPWPLSGSLAVEVFFALSGWLIGAILLSTESHQLPRFYFNRALRIWTPYYIALTIVVLASLLRDPIDSKWYEFVLYKATWVYNVFGTQQLTDHKASMPLDGSSSHFWSVNAEEQFYLLAPLLLVVFARHGRKVTVWILMAVLLWLTHRYTALALGVIGAILNARYPGLNRQSSCLILMSILLVISAFGLSFVREYHSIGYQTWAPLFSIAIVVLLARVGSRTEVGCFFGGLSYPLYLNHWIGGVFVHGILQPFGLNDSTLSVALSFLVNYSFAAFLYWFVEKKVLALRKTLYSHARGKAVAVLAYAAMIAGLMSGIILTHSTIAISALALYCTSLALVVARTRR